MRIDLDHNKILKETMSEGFRLGLTEGLIPRLSEIYGTALDGVMMYEDHLKDDFKKDDYCYYPLTLVVGGIAKALWIRWSIREGSKFEGGNPYKYLGEKLDFEISEDTPIAFANAISGKQIYAEGSVKITVSAAVKDFTFLAGKYSQTFIDEMARQLTAVIERASAVKGLAESSIELTVFFAPDTYMEHTSENVTYRRLLISAKGSGVRDLWIKWTRLDSASAFTVADDVTGDNIRFELGEDVSHKIREKEYRFLVYNNPEKYRMAMGRKNITEWRDLIKRAVKKGELMKINEDYKDDKHVSEVSDKLSEILEKAGVSIPEVKIADDFQDNTAEVDRALRMAILGSGASADPAVSAPSAEPAEPKADDDFIIDDPDFDLSDAPEDDKPEDPDPQADVIEIVKPSVPKAHAAQDIAPEKAEPAPVPADSEPFELMVEIETLEAKLRAADERTKLAAEEKELISHRLDVALGANAELTARIEKLEEELISRGDAANTVIEENKRLREALENQKAAYDDAIAASEALKDNIKSLNLLVESAREEARRSEEKLREQIMLDQKEREREKLLYAEAARLAREEAERLERERADEKERERAERERLEASLRLEEEKRRAEADHNAELERIEREINAEKARRQDQLDKAREIRLRMEAEAKRTVDEKYGVIETPSPIVKEIKPEPAPTAAPVSNFAPAARDFSAPVSAPAPEAHRPSEIDFSVEEDSFAPKVKEEPKPEPVVIPKAPVYVSRQIKLLFIDPVDVRITEKLRELIGEVIKRTGKGSVYIKMKASLQDANTVVLDVLEIPEDELQLLVEIIQHIGNAGLGIYKGTLE